jgi:hypothetical protein
MVKDLSPLFCECLLLLTWLRATRQAMQWFPLVMPSFVLSFACDVLPARVPLQAIRLE